MAPVVVCVIGANKAVFIQSVGVAEDAVTRLKFLPLAMMLLSVIGLGGAIWIVRRR